MKKIISAIIIIYIIMLMLFTICCKEELEIKEIETRELDTKLLSAIEGYDLSTIKALLHKGANINVQDEDGRTGLMELVRTTRDFENNEVMIDKLYALIDLFIENGANLDLQDNNGTTVLMEAVIWRRKEDIIKKILENGCDVNIKGNEGTALIIAAKKRYCEIFELLISYGADFNIKDKNGIPPLFHLFNSTSSDIRGELTTFLILIGQKYHRII